MRSGSAPHFSPGRRTRTELEAANPIQLEEWRTETDRGTSDDGGGGDDDAVRGREGGTGGGRGEEEEKPHRYVTDCASE